ncbi:TPA: glycosyltransferase family 4 protein [Raoultella planticola]
MGNKIIVFTRSLPMHNIGGMEVVCWDLCCSLAKRGFEVTIITTTIPKWIPYDNYNERLKIITIDGTSPGKYSSLWWEQSARYLSNFSSQDIKAVISISAAGFSCLKHRHKFKNTKFIMQAHGTSFDEFISKIKSCSLKKWCTSVKNVIWFFKDTFSYKKFDYIVAIGDSVESSMRKFPTSKIINKEQIVKIENGIDTDLFSAKNDIKEKILTGLNIDSKAKIIVSASRLHSEKGVDNNIRAFKTFHEKSPNSYYIICGDGVEKDKLLQLSSDLDILNNIIFLGAVERERLSQILTIADVFLFLTKRVEGLPLNVLEAMSVGVPIIISSHLTFTESDKLKKVPNTNYTLIADQIEELIELYTDEKESYIPARNTLAFSVDRYCQLIIS